MIDVLETSGGELGETTRGELAGLKDDLRVENSAFNSAMEDFNEAISFDCCCRTQETQKNGSLEEDWMENAFNWNGLRGH